MRITCDNTIMQQKQLVFSKQLYVMGTELESRSVFLSQDKIFFDQTYKQLMKLEKKRGAYSLKMLSWRMNIRKETMDLWITISWNLLAPRMVSYRNIKTQEKQISKINVLCLLTFELRKLGQFFGKQQKYVFFENSIVERTMYIHNQQHIFTMHLHNQLNCIYFLGMY